MMLSQTDFKTTAPKIVTHDATFHPDDLFAVTTLLLLCEKRGWQEPEITRTRDVDIIAAADFVVDVGQVYSPGKQRFDHHQLDFGETYQSTTVDGETKEILLAAFGLVWREYGEELCDDKAVAHEVQEDLVQPLDASDNGFQTYDVKYKDLSPVTLQHILHLYTPLWNDDFQNYDDAFKRALPLARFVLERKIDEAKAKVEATKLAEVAYQAAPDKRVIELPHAMPHSNVVQSHPEPLYTVYMRPHDGKWQIKAVEKPGQPFVHRKSLPEAWRAKSGEELQKITGVTDAIFCHRSGFMCVVGSREGALKMAEMALVL